MTSIQVKCGKCRDKLDGAIVSLDCCLHRFHPWCLWSSLDEKNVCIVTNCPSGHSLEAFVKYNKAEKIEVPMLFTTPYIIVDAIMRKLGSRPPYDNGRYTSICTNWNLPTGQVPPFKIHPPLMPSMNEEKLKDLYHNLNKTWILKLDRNKIAKLGIESADLKISYSDFKLKYGHDLHEFVTLIPNKSRNVFDRYLPGPAGKWEKSSHSSM